MNFEKNDLLGTITGDIEFNGDVDGRVNLDDVSHETSINGEAQPDDVEIKTCIVDNALMSWCPTSSVGIDAIPFSTVIKTLFGGDIKS